MPDETKFENNPSGMVRRWNAELQQADKKERKWRDRANKVIDLYRDERDNAESGRDSSAYNILWSNTETLKPQMYSQTPEPVAQRRFHDKDPIGRQAAMVLQRGLEYAIDAYDFDEMADQLISDYLLTGRAQARIRYIPHFEAGDPPKIPVSRSVGDDGTVLALADFESGPAPVEESQIQVGEMGEAFVMGEPEDELVYEEVQCEYVNWEDYRQSPARTWEEVRWVAFRHRMTRAQLVESFGDAGRDVPLEVPEEGESTDDSDQEHVAKRATVWEIWHKDKREVIFIAEGKKDAPIEVRPDPLGLENFFPCPKPLYSVKTTNTMVPIPEYTLYQDQAEELNLVTQRISRLTSALRAVGAYAGEHKDALSRIMQSEENVLVPVEDWAALTDGGKFEDKIAWIPIDRIAEVLAGLYNQRRELLEIIFQITGISDIFRGATNPNEALGTQRLKSQFGVQRLQPRQRAVQRFIRDLMELKAEIMAEMFSPETLQIMTGLEVPPQVQELMANDKLRGFRVDIETDSTIAADEAQDKQAVSEMFQAIAEFIEQGSRAVMTGMMTPQAVKELVLFGMRRFRVSRAVEEAMMQDVQPRPQQPDPIELAKVQNEQQKMQLDAQVKMRDQQIELAKLRQAATEADDENMRHFIDALIKQADSENKVFIATEQEKTKLKSNALDSTS